MNRLSLRNNNRLKLETSTNLPIILEESIEEYTFNKWKQNRMMSTCNQLDLESLGSWHTMPKNFPDIVMTLFRPIAMLCGTDIFCEIFLTFNMNVKNILHITVRPIEHYYGSEWCYGCARLRWCARTHTHIGREEEKRRKVTRNKIVFSCPYPLL